MRQKTVATGFHEQYAEQGYFGPIRVLSTDECQRFLKAASSAPLPLDWNKGHGATSRVFYEMATHPAILGFVAALVGENVMLWGARIESRLPGSIHPWHSDIESHHSSGGSISVWIGLEHTNRDSSLLLVPTSHRFGITVQQMRHRHGKRRTDVTNEDITRWARERDPQSGVVQPEATDGDALFFDGRLWHGSHNTSPRTRRALLLQYATPDIPIRIPDLNYLDWPFQYLPLPRPACVMVRGKATLGENRIVPAPVAGAAPSQPRLTSRVYPLRIPLGPDEQGGWKPYPIFQGSTANVERLTCHASVLTQNQCPHPPHRHDDEELLLLLAGQADLILPESSTNPFRLTAGQFVYYPAQFPHTLRTVSQEPANYLMLKWRNLSAPGPASALGFRHARLPDETPSAKAPDGFSVHRVFAGPTMSLRKLECHTSALEPGAGYQPHIDSHDVAIVVLAGEVETLGERVGPHAIIFCPAGEPHGLRNPGAEIARYVVFEFHGRQTQSPSLIAKLVDPRRWRRKLKQMARRFRA